MAPAAREDRHSVGSVPFYARRNSSGQTLFMTPMGELIRCEPIMVTPETTIAEAARTMSQHSVSSVLVNEGDRVCGIVTDRDLRNRVLAQGRDPVEPVSAVMTAEPITLDASSPVLEGILAMAGRGIHHLPLTRDQHIVGMVTTRDLMNLQTQHPLYLAAQVQKAGSIERLVSICRQVPRLFELLVASGMRAEQVPKVLTTINDSVTRRLIVLAPQQLGPAPAPFTWLVFGSQAREEQSIKTDQDNGLVYADEAPPHADEWFAALARIVCDGLNTALKTAQFTITVIGSEWVATKVKHRVRHKGKTIYVESKVGIKLSKELAKKKGLPEYGEEVW